MKERILKVFTVYMKNLEKKLGSHPFYSLGSFDFLFFLSEATMLAHETAKDSSKEEELYSLFHDTFCYADRYSLLRLKHKKLNSQESIWRGIILVRLADLWNEEKRAVEQFCRFRKGFLWIF